MKKIFSLTKVMLKSSFSTMAVVKQKKKHASKINLIAVILLYSIISTSMFLTSQDILKLFVKLNQEALVIDLVFLAASLYILVIGIATVPTIFYFSKDLENLLAMPLKSDEILFAKTFTTYITILVGSSFVLIPFGISYQMIANPPLIFLLYYILAFLILPLLPMAIAITFVVLIFRFIPKFNNKDLFTYVTSFLMIAIIFGINFSSIGNSNLLDDIMTGDSNLTLAITTLIPTIKILSQAVNDFNFFKIIFGLVLSMIFLGLMVKLLAKTYFKGAIGVSTTSKKRRPQKLKKYRMDKKISSPVFTILKTDFKNILRTPVFMINYYLPVLIVPFFSVIPLIGILSSEQFSTEMIADLILAVQVGLNEIELAVILPYAIIGSFVFSFFLSSMSTITSTSISREGERMEFYKSMPIKMMTVINSKLLLGIVSSLAVPLITLTLLAFALKLKVIIIISALIALIIAAVFSNTLGIVLDVFYPKLVWDNETQAIKQNFLTIVPIFGSFLIIGLFVFIFNQFKNDQLLAAVLILLLAVLLSFVIYQYVIKHFGVKRLDKAIERI
ncbi:MAG: hypothetical protein GX769_04655 [Erysipelothrix sp.]|nr:hypothetical protein [Erysipelothrix sp.]